MKTMIPGKPFSLLRSAFVASAMLLGHVELDAQEIEVAIRHSAPVAVDSWRHVDERVREHIKYLASDQLAGRRPGTEGNRLAAEYIGRAFDRIGLWPLPPGRATDGFEAFYHRFSYLSGVEFGPKNGLTIQSPAGQNLIQLGTQFSPMTFSSSGSVSAPLLFAGYGITVSDTGYDDYRGVDAKGKIVVVMRYSPDGEGIHGELARYGAWSSKVRTARDHGASGIIFINRPGDSAALVRLDLNRGFTDAGIPSVFALSTIFSGLRDPRGRTLEQLQKAIDADKRPASFDMPGWSADLSTDITLQRDSVPNVVGMLPGTDPVLKDQYIVIGAHFDHLGMGGEGSLYSGHDSAIHHGADDNASGTAGMLVLAERLEREHTNRHSIIFVAFNAEEEGLLGSAEIVKSFPIPLEKVTTMINLDMIGRLDSNKLAVEGTGSSPGWEPMLQRVNNNRFRLKFTQDGFGRSDHSSFYAKNVPVLFFYTGAHSDYHRPGDTWEKINYPGEVSVLRYVHDVFSTIDSMETPPPFTKVKSAARASGGFSVYVGTIPDYGYEGKGLRLTGVSEGGPAATAGIHAGDVIVRMGSKKIDNIYDYTDALGTFRPKERVEIEVLREGKPVVVNVVLGSR